MKRIFGRNRKDDIYVKFTFENRKNEVLEKGWGYRTEHQVIDSRDDYVAIFYDEKLANGYIAMMNALQD
jgi:hypothetical protein